MRMESICRWRISSRRTSSVAASLGLPGSPARPMRRVARQQLEPLGDGLHHPELDSVVHQLHEMAGTGRSGMHVAPFDGKAPEEGLEPLHSRPLASSHETGAMPRTSEPAAGPEVDELDGWLAAHGATAHNST